jgi:hypothetical protein
MHFGTRALLRRVLLIRFGFEWGFMIQIIIIGGGLPSFLGAYCSSSLFPATVVSVSMPVVLRGAKNLRVDTALGGRLTAADIGTGLVYFLAVWGVIRDMPLAFFTSWKLSSWDVGSTKDVHCTILSYLCTHIKDGIQFIQRYRVHAVKRAKQRLPIQTFRKVYSFLLCAIHNRGSLRSFPHFSRCASGKVLNVTEYSIYLLHYRSCFWVFIRDDMTFRFQQC